MMVITRRIELNVYDPRAKCVVPCVVEVDADFEDIARQLAAKALCNKSGVSKIVRGAVKVTVNRKG